MHPSMRTPRHRASKPSAAFTVGGALAAAFAVFVVFSLGRLWQASSGASGSGGAKTPQERAWAFRGGSVDTLVVYIFSATDLEYINNLNFFLKFGIREGDGAEYVIILQQDESGEVPKLDIKLPSNARVLTHANQCYDWGTFGWLLRSGEVNVQKYKYFVLLNSSVRGPFLPPYVPARAAWHKLLTSRLDATTKLVGPVVSCEGTPFKGNAASQWKTNPHVQSYTIAMDRAALDILRRDSEVLKCYNDRWDAIWYAELGSSAAILNAGYNIASILHRYQGVDWRKQGNWACNQRLNPTGDFYFDGVTLSVYELVFVKVKDSLLHASGAQAATAVKYHDWIDGVSKGGKQDIWQNQFIEEPEVFKAPRVAMMGARDAQCFDHTYYREHNHDLKSFTDEQLWHHYRHSGQFEPRPMRFTCDWDVPIELTDELERIHATMGLQPYPKRVKLKDAGAAGGLMNPLAEELERQRMRNSIV